MSHPGLQEQPTLSVSSSLGCSSSVFSSLSQLTSSCSPLSPPGELSSSNSSCRDRFVRAFPIDGDEARTEDSPDVYRLWAPSSVSMVLRFPSASSSPTEVSRVKAGGSDSLTVTIESCCILGVSLLESPGEVGEPPSSAAIDVDEGAVFGDSVGEVSWPLELSPGAISN